MDWASVRRHVVFAVLVCSVAVAGAWAQSGTTSLHGTVRDKSGAFVSGAKVSLTNAELSLSRETTSGSEGEFDFVALPPGNYKLTVDATGFRKFEQTRLQLLVNSPATANVKLEIGTALQTIEVVEQTEQLNTTDASL